MAARAGRRAVSCVAGSPIAVLAGHGAAAMQSMPGVFRLKGLLTS